ncbi:MAG: DsbA family protein [Alphaproteobacteria bacterium]
MTRRLTTLTACAATAVAAAGLTALALSASARADKVAVPDALREQVRQVIMDNPEIIIEALDAFEQRREREAEGAQKEAIGANMDALWSLPGLHVAGNPTGKIKMVEFFDYRCGFCKQAMPSVIEMIEENKDLAVAFVEFPILSPESVTASKAAIAAGFQDRYFDMHRALMKASGSLNEARIMAIASNLGLDTKRLKKDMASEKTDTIVQAHRDMATTLRVNGTPSFIIGSEPVTGWREDMVRHLLAEAKP